MKQLADVVLKVADKYMQNIDLIIDGNKLTLNYFKNKNNQEIYKTSELKKNAALEINCVTQSGLRRGEL